MLSSQEISQMIEFEEAECAKLLGEDDLLLGDGLDRDIPDDNEDDVVNDERLPEGSQGVGPNPGGLSATRCAIHLSVFYQPFTVM